ncbi:MAG TPA: glycosyltransferase [Verrucomicrobiae bacterium]|nr:glycosyltransferase [Verrucomicrobiae bacterium]
MPAGPDCGVLPEVPTISVIVITRNEGSELESTVRNLLDTADPKRLEIIVVDDGSTDDSTSFLREMPEVRLLRSTGQGVARARNLGASEASGEIVLFADAHVRAPENWDGPIADALRDESVGSVAPAVCDMSKPEARGFGLTLAGADLKATWLRKTGGAPYVVPILPGCFLALRRDTFRKSGGYDPGMRQLGGNDAELSFRLWSMGYEQKVIPQIEVAHLFRRRTPYPAQWLSLLHNRLRMAMVHFQEARVARVVGALRIYEPFPAALAMTVDSDVHERRAWMARNRRFTDDWFFERFTLAC